MLKLRARVSVYFTLGTVILAMTSAVPSFARPVDIEPLQMTRTFDMNRHINWYGGSSFPWNPDQHMIVEEAALFHYNDHARVEWGRPNWGVFDVYLNCYGGELGSPNQVQLYFWSMSTGGLYLDVQDCYYGVYTEIHWQTPYVTFSYDAIFLFMWADGSLKYGPNPSWGNAAIKIESTSVAMPRFWHMEDIQWRKIDSCATLNLACNDLHSEVTNFVHFNEATPYLKTIQFPAFGGDARVALYAKCTLGTCRIQLSFDDGPVVDRMSFDDTLGWSEVWFPNTYPISSGYHTITIEPYLSVQSFAWTYVVLEVT
jgi:hypothetical protein